MNNEDNVYEFLGNVQVLTKEGVETKLEELEASLGTSLDEKIDEAVSNAVIDAGGVTPALLDEVKAELVATDTALQAADTALSERVTALEENGSGGTPEYTFIVDSQEKLDQLCTDSVSTTAVTNDYTRVFITNGDYTIGYTPIRMDNELVPVHRITGESQDGVILTLIGSTGFTCFNEQDTITREVSNITILHNNQNNRYGFYNIWNLYIHDCTVNATVQNETSSPNDQKTCTFYHSIKDDTLRQQNITYNVTNAVNYYITYTQPERFRTITAAEINITQTDFVCSNTVLLNCTLNLTNSTLASVYGIDSCTVNITDDLTATAKTVTYITNSAHDIHNSTINYNYAVKEAFPDTEHNITLCVSKSIYDTDIQINFDTSDLSSIPQITAVNQTAANTTKSQYVINTNITFNVPLESTLVDSGLRIARTRIAKNVKLVGIVRSTTLRGEVKNCTVLYATTGFKNCNTVIDCITTPVLMYASTYTMSSGGTPTVPDGLYQGCSNLVRCTASQTHPQIILANTQALLDRTQANSYYTEYATFVTYKDCTTLVQCSGYASPVYINDGYGDTILYDYYNCCNLIACNSDGHNIYSKNLKHTMVSGSSQVKIYDYAFYKCESISNCIRNKHTMVFKQADRLPNEEGVSITYERTYFDTCTNISNCTYVSSIGASTESDWNKTTASSGTTSAGMPQYSINHEYITAKNCVNVHNSAFAWSSSKTTFGFIKNTTGIHNCVYKSGRLDTTTCSASQTYVADYAVADTPAGGFNKAI